MNTNIERTKCYADAGHQYCYLLRPEGWRNVGMVPDSYRMPFIRGYFALPHIAKIAFVPFCFNDSLNAMLHSEIEAYAHSIVTPDCLRKT